MRPLCAHSTPRPFRILLLHACLLRQRPPLALSAQGCADLHKSFDALFNVFRVAIMNTFYREYEAWVKEANAGVADVSGMLSDEGFEAWLRRMHASDDKMLASNVRIRALFPAAAPRCVRF